MARGFAVMAVLLVAAEAAGQAITPQLSRPQRDALRRIVAAVETASAEPVTGGASWQMHLLRASDGSHYVAFSVEPPAAAARGPVLLYVRLATSSLSGRGVERSAVGEWLAGTREDPRFRPRTSIAIGEMPNFGAGAIAVRGSTASSGSTDLRLMELERERTRREKEEIDRKRRAELDGAQLAPRDLLPFEDFDFSATVTKATGSIQRAFTAGPGDYDLYVAWTDASSGASPIHILKRSLTLPPASALGLSVSSIIVADAVTTRDTPYPPAQQAAHPYAIGLTDLTPAVESIFTRDEKLTIAFQVINPRPTELGKPDIGITFRIVRVTEGREQPVAALTPQEYTAGTLPDDFDLRLGHPVFAAMSVPLESLQRGSYRLQIAVNDRAAGRGTSAMTDFTVVGTPTSLLSEAPSVAAPFRRELALTAGVLEEIITRLRPAAPSAALARALESLRQKRFAELMVEETVETSEQGIRAALTAIALFAIGDPSSAVLFQRAIQLNSPVGPSQFFLGAARAVTGRDADAVIAWQRALDAGMPPAIVLPSLVNAHFRLGEFSRASQLIESGPASATTRELAALDIASGRERDAIPLLERRLTAEPGDLDAEWLLVHALYASLVRQPDPGLSEKFVRAARAYVTAERVNAPLVAEWLMAIDKP